MTDRETKDVSSATRANYSGVDSVVLDTFVVSDALKNDKYEAPSDLFGAAAGIMNGILIGAAFWGIVLIVLHLFDL